MEIFEYLKRSTLQLPITFKGSNYIEETQRFFASFQNDIKLTNDLDEQYRLTAGDLQKVRTLQENLVGVIQHFFNNLLPWGYLFLGNAESLFGVSEAFDLVHLPGASAYVKRRCNVEEAPQ